MRKSSFASVIATSFLAGETTDEQAFHRASETLGHRWKWLKPLADRFSKRFLRGTRPRHREVVRFLLADAGFRRAIRKYSSELAIHEWLTDSQKMNPVVAARRWAVPAIETAGDLAKWLNVSASDLLWFADLKGFGYEPDSYKLQHYNYKVLAKQFGSVRLIEAPKLRLRGLQKRILTEILEKIPPHQAVHGFVRGRSIQTFSSPHVGKRVILKMDLQNFFPTFSGVRIQSLFRTMGYPETVADLLGGICTNATPRSVWKATDAITGNDLHELKSLYSRPHLPQGAPTSPLLANLCTYRVDCRLSGLAKSAGAEYTRYADDLAFSGERGFERRVERFSNHVAAVLLDEGFTVHFRKTRVMREGVRQHLAGLVLNRHINIIRSDFEKLKATLTNCARFGPASQNRTNHSQFRAHLEGRVAFVESVNPARGRRLRQVLEQIEWSE